MEKVKKKKIMIASYNLNYGGIEKSLITLLKNFNYEKYEVTLFLEKKEGIYIKEVPSYVQIKEYKVSYCKIKIIRKIINFIKQRFFILKYKNKFSASICFATYSLPCNFMALHSSSNPVLYVHSNYTNIYDDNQLKMFFDKRNIHRFHHIVFVSVESKNDLLNYYPSIKKKAIVINNLVDYESIMSASKENCDEDCFKEKNIIFIGRLEEKSKKVSRIIEVARKLKNIHFILIGDGPDKGLYEKMIYQYKLSNVLLLGAKKNPYSYLKKADYLLLTSDYEGFPVVYNEAIVLHIPIITTLNLSDDAISIGNRFGIITKKDVSSIAKTITNAYKEHWKIKEIVDFNVINKNRMLKLEKIMEGKDAEI